MTRPQAEQEDFLARKLYEQGFCARSRRDTSFCAVFIEKSVQGREATSRKRFRSLCGSVSEGVCLHSRARAARSLVVLALSGCERSGRACSQAARNLVMLAFPGYKGPGRTCPPKKIGPGRACPHGSRKFVGSLFRSQGICGPSATARSQRIRRFHFERPGDFSLPILIDGVRMYASSVILLNALFCAGVLFCNLDSARFRLRHGQALCMPVRISLPTSS